MTVRRPAVKVAVVLAAIFLLVSRSGELLVKSDPLPAHVDGAVVLQGMPGESVRVHEGVELLVRGKVSEVVLSLPREAYWGEKVAPVAQNYMRQKYGETVASHIVVCETEPEVNSTRQEAEAISGCVRERGWKTMVVVTSDYHTRRAGIIWREVMKVRDPGLLVMVHGVRDPDFQTSWWRARLSAKTWLMEFTKLVWTETLGRLEK